MTDDLIEEQQNNIVDRLNSDDVFGEVDDFYTYQTDADMLSSSRATYTSTVDGEILTAQDQFNIISGVNEIPPRYRELAPELTSHLITYNNILGNVEMSEWQIKSRSVLRKRQMSNPLSGMTGADKSTITYFNDLLLTRARNGFERKMSISSLSGVLSEAEMESAPYSATPQKKGILDSIFNRN